MTLIQIIRPLCLLLLTSLVVVAQSPKKELNDQLWEAARRGDAAAVTSLLDKGAEVNARFRYGTTALFKAAERGNTEVVKVLLARGADVTVKDTFYGATAMSWALDKDHLEVVSALLEKDPGSVSDVLMTGAREGKAPLVKLALAQGGAKPETLTSALALAMEDKDKTEIADMLKKAGAVPPPEVALPTLQSYVGNYKGETGPEVGITLTDGKLFAVVTGQRPFVLIAINSTTFRFLAFDGTFNFQVESGKTTGLTFKQGETTTQMKRLEEAKKP